MDAVLFDLGKVLLDYNPRYYYERFFAGDELALDRFPRRSGSREIGCSRWIAALPMDEAIATRQQRLTGARPADRALERRLAAHAAREILGTVAVLDELRQRGRRLYALTNFSHETWPVARARFEFLGWFEDVVVSGEVGLVKPDPRIYRLAIDRCRLEPARTVFVDDYRLTSRRRAPRACTGCTSRPPSGCARTWRRSGCSSLQDTRGHGLAPLRAPRAPGASPPKRRFPPLRHPSPSPPSAGRTARR